VYTFYSIPLISSFISINSYNNNTTNNKLYVDTKIQSKPLFRSVDNISKTI